MSLPEDEIVRNDWIAEQLSSLPFVEWDRFTTTDVSHNDQTPDGEQIVTAYGWINRPHDDYKDFVVLMMWPIGEHVSFTTSSDRYSPEIHTRLYDEHEEGHNPCRRIEHEFDVPNVVELAEGVPEP